MSELCVYLRVEQASYLHTFNQDAICAKECARMPPPPGGIRLKCRNVPFKASNCENHKIIKKLQKDIGTNIWN